ncbi:hypothetical protein BACCAP_03684 [Pseudoflavonifractor capillosus ATCC 29799]|uniref:Uncharacterized protein n=1 Tax=Pseudoflavonifractor capillosus ATCC 29799 TaxID=411467 RepID=A6NZN2_9FIRM|nr:hypothetical protein BACCAP_03684 [Pseudoflavonifractor capillosus ATCC 29799]
MYLKLQLISTVRYSHFRNYAWHFATTVYFVVKSIYSIIKIPRLRPFER